MLYEYVHGKTRKTALGFITNKVTKFYSIANFSPKVALFISHYALTDEHGVPLTKEFHRHSKYDTYCESHFNRESEKLTLIDGDTDKIKQQFKRLESAYENT